MPFLSIRRSAALLTRGSDPIRANRMEYDRQKQVLQLRGQVRARIEN